MGTMSFLKLVIVTVLVHQGIAADSEKNENSSVPAPPGCADDAATSGASTSSTNVTTTGASTTRTSTTTTETSTVTTTSMPVPNHRDYGLYIDEKGCQYKVLKWRGQMVTVDCMAECGNHEVQLELGTPCAEVIPGRRAPRFGSRECRIGQCVRTVCTYKSLYSEVCRVPYASFHPGYRGRYRSLLERYREF
uniref:Evasin n=1 Tax=Rhipicephalus zambeziensis TaxID=60191 RepID=A0A224Y922_9ACAR